MWWAKAAQRSRRLRFLAQRLGGRGQQGVDERAHCRFGQGAGELVDDLAVDHGLHSGNAAHAELRGERLVLVGIHLGQAEAALVLLGELLQDRAEAAAGPAPGRPEVREDGHAAGSLDDFLHEVGFGDVDGVGCHVTDRWPAAAGRRVRADLLRSNALFGGELSAPA